MSDHRIGENMRKILDVLAVEDRATPRLIRKRTDLSKQSVHDSLGRLVDAGWVEKIDRGLYELQEDPR